MTRQDKLKVLELREQGYTYKEISNELSISIGSVKYICQTEKFKGTCINCGRTIKSLPHKKPKKFCSDRCRWEWHNEKRREIRLAEKREENEET